MGNVEPRRFPQDGEPEVDGKVACTQHSVFSDGRRLRSAAMMRWRSAEDVLAAVTDADLEVDEIYGGNANRSAPTTES